MPTYDYECETCNLTYEVEQKMADPPLKKCETPKCKGKPKRLISGGSVFMLKGGGWAKDGY